MNPLSKVLSIIEYIIIRIVVFVIPLFYLTNSSATADFSMTYKLLWSIVLGNSIIVLLSLLHFIAFKTIVEVAVSMQQTKPPLPTHYMSPARIVAFILCLICIVIQVIDDIVLIADEYRYVIYYSLLITSIYCLIIDFLKLLIRIGILNVFEFFVFEDDDHRFCSYTDDSGKVIGEYIWDRLKKLMVSGIAIILLPIIIAYIFTEAGLFFIGASIIVLVLHYIFGILNGLYKVAWVLMIMLVAHFIINEIIKRSTFLDNLPSFLVSINNGRNLRTSFGGNCNRCGKRMSFLNANVYSDYCLCNRCKKEVSKNARLFDEKFDVTNKSQLINDYIMLDSLSTKSNELKRKFSISQQCGNLKLDLQNEIIHFDRSNGLFFSIADIKEFSLIQRCKGNVKNQSEKGNVSAIIKFVNIKNDYEYLVKNGVIGTNPHEITITEKVYAGEEVVDYDVYYSAFTDDIESKEIKESRYEYQDVEVFVYDPPKEMQAIEKLVLSIINKYHPGGHMELDGEMYYNED